jgi:cell division septum initiation protein DivIVA
VTTKTEQDLAAKVEALEAEIDELARRRAEAVAQIRHAERRFEELEGRRSVLSPKTFAGDKEAVKELEEVEDEHDRIARSVRVARSAVPEFDRMLKEAKEKHAKAVRDVHREEADELYRQSAALNAERDELAKRLREVLDRQADLFHDRVQTVRRYDQDQANSAFISGDGIDDWLTGAFSRWLLR